MSSWLSTASVTLRPVQPGCPRPAFLQPSAVRPPPCGAQMHPYTGIHPRRLHASHAPSPLNLGTAFLPQHPQAHSCRPAPLGLWVFTFHSAAEKGGLSLSDSSPLPQGNCRMPPCPPSPRQLEASGFRRGDQPVQAWLLKFQYSALKLALVWGEPLLDPPKHVCQDPAHPSPT